MLGAGLFSPKVAAIDENFNACDRVADAGRRGRDAGKTGER